MHEKRLVYLLSIRRDGVMKYCHSYSPVVSPETIYWADERDERMSIPYGFRSFAQAEWMFWQWKNRTGAEGWRYVITEEVV